MNSSCKLSKSTIVFASLLFFLLFTTSVFARSSAAISLETAIAITEITPAAGEQLESYRAYYDYDKGQPLNFEVYEEDLRGNMLIRKFRFDSRDSERVPGWLILPDEGKGGPWPLIVSLHPYGGNKSNVDLLSRFFPGYAFVALDAQYHGDRKVDGVDIYSENFTRSRAAVVQTIVDYRRALDYLETLDCIDSSRTGLIGISMGSIMGSILAGVDDRIDASVLIIGGGNWALLGALTEIGPGVAMRERIGFDEVIAETCNRELAPCDPMHWVGQISPRPVQFWNGKFDNIVPVPCSEQYIKAAGEPKQSFWQPIGHFFLPNTIVGGKRFLDHYLKSDIDLLSPTLPEVELPAWQRFLAEPPAFADILRGITRRDDHAHQPAN
ncbi:MAG: acetylxylan esterase [Planctomycetes bacterium]|nr:acetylxylan esterase [Planctomycetota bacterium]